MPLYTFDIIVDDKNLCPSETIDFSSEDLAREYAIGLASTIQSGEKAEKRHVVSIRDEAGTQLHEIGPITYSDQAQVASLMGPTQDHLHVFGLH